jgi:hypothetical protein
MFAYYDRHGLLVGTRTMAALLGRQPASGSAAPPTNDSATPEQPS